MAKIDSPRDQYLAPTALRPALIALNGQFVCLPQWLDGCIKICYTSLRADSANRSLSGTTRLGFQPSMARSVGETIQQHLSEEFGHDVSLMNDRKERPPAWDSILDACSCWFSWKMFTLDNSEKTVLVHLVLEASAHLFFIEAHKVMSKYGETDYFKIHAEVDEHHETMGLNLLEDLREIDYKNLLNIQQQGWDILNSVCNRIAELSTSTQ